MINELAEEFGGVKGLLFGSGFQILKLGGGEEEVKALIEKIFLGLGNEVMNKIIDSDF